VGRKELPAREGPSALESRTARRYGSRPCFWFLDLAVGCCPRGFPRRAARSGDVSVAESAVEELTKSVEERQNRERKNGYRITTEKATDLREGSISLARVCPGKNRFGARSSAGRRNTPGKKWCRLHDHSGGEMLADMRCASVLRKTRRSVPCRRRPAGLAEAKTVFGAKIGGPRRFTGVGRLSGS
jgi:hypothetical protein